MFPHIFIIAASLASIANCGYYDYASKAPTDDYSNQISRPGYYMNGYMDSSAETVDSRDYMQDVFEEQEKPRYGSSRYDRGKGNNEETSMRGSYSSMLSDMGRNREKMVSSYDERPMYDDRDGYQRPLPPRMQRDDMDRGRYGNSKRNFVKDTDSRVTYDLYETRRPEYSDNSRREDFGGHSMGQMMGASNSRYMDPSSREEEGVVGGPLAMVDYGKYAEDDKQDRRYRKKMKPGEVEQLRYTRDDLYYQRAIDDVADFKAGMRFKKSGIEKYGKDAEEFIDKVAKPTKGVSIFSVVSDLSDKGDRGRGGYGNDRGRFRMDESAEEGQYGRRRKGYSKRTSSASRDRYSSDYSRDGLEGYEEDRDNLNSNNKRDFGGMKMERRKNRESSSSNTRRYPWQLDRYEHGQSNTEKNIDNPNGRGGYNFLHGDLFDEKSVEQNGVASSDKYGMYMQTNSRGGRDSNDRVGRNGNRMMPSRAPNRYSRQRGAATPPANNFRRRTSSVRDDYMKMVRDNRFY